MRVSRSCISLSLTCFVFISILPACAGPADTDDLPKEPAFFSSGTDPFGTAFAERGGGEGYGGDGAYLILTFQNLGECRGRSGRIKNQIQWWVGGLICMTVQNCVPLSLPAAIDTVEFIAQSLDTGTFVFQGQKYSLAERKLAPGKSARQFNCRRSSLEFSL